MFRILFCSGTCINFECVLKKVIFCWPVLCERGSADCGVPQGSIQGPLLFLIFNNDFRNPPVFQFTFLAHDSILSCRFEKTASTSMSTVLSYQRTSIYDWISANKLEVNIEKCNFIQFSYKKSLILHPMKINSSSIYNQQAA